METMHFHITQMDYFIRSMLLFFCIEVAPMTNLAINIVIGVKVNV